MLFACCRCADMLSDDIKSGKYKVLSIHEKDHFLKCVYPPELEDAFQNWWMKQNKQLRIEAKKD